MRCETSIFPWTWDVLARHGFARSRGYVVTWLLMLLHFPSSNRPPVSSWSSSWNHLFEATGELLMLIRSVQEIASGNPSWPAKSMRFEWEKQPLHGGLCLIAGGYTKHLWILVGTRQYWAQLLNWHLGWHHCADHALGHAVNEIVCWLKVVGCFFCINIWLKNPQSTFHGGVNEKS